MNVPPVGGDYGGSGFEVAGTQPHRVLHNGGGRWTEATDGPGRGFQTNVGQPIFFLILCHFRLIWN